MFLLPRLLRGLGGGGGDCSEDLRVAVVIAKEVGVLDSAFHKLAQGGLRGRMCGAIGGDAAVEVDDLGIDRDGGRGDAGGDEYGSDPARYPDCKE
jgi:hypothetical protein